MSLVIHGFIANLACFRLIRFCGACLLIVVEIIKQKNDSDNVDQHLNLEILFQLGKNYLSILI